MYNVYLHIDVTYKYEKKNKTVDDAILRMVIKTEKEMSKSSMFKIIYIIT